MAGRDQHFIPQLLQRGFSARQLRKGHQVVVFRRGQQPFQTNTRNSFVEKDFYGPPSAAVVDTLITDEEARLGPFLLLARQHAVTQVIGPNQDATDFALQMAIRGRWIRDFAQRGVRILIERIHGALTQPSSKTAVYKTWFAQNPDWLRDELMKGVHDFLPLDPLGFPG
jgi:hypothetical protein